MRRERKLRQLEIKLLLRSTEAEQLREVHQDLEALLEKLDYKYYLARLHGKEEESIDEGDDQGLEGERYIRL
ncbi:hypothetical protein NDU88_003818 [Pleurodeles waltl]|uniref:Uncharacterized protein n=1 Tax=Pleurodeles waltl TaxID=8319 RepID=A0AAV7LJK8_PLEWA|nr:hypothetical protein NDU88_003818 [Pleurodeles waltl]